MTSGAPHVEHLLRELAPRVLGAVARRHEDFTAAEDAAQEAPRGRVGPYQLQAAVAAVHSEASCAEETDWPQILALYGVLLRMTDNPMVALNHAVAAAMVHGPARGLELLRPLDEDSRLAGHHRLEAVRAHLLEMAGDREAAARSFRLAAERTRSTPERDYLLLKAAQV